MKVVHESTKRATVCSTRLTNFPGMSRGNSRQSRRSRKSRINVLNDTFMEKFKSDKQTGRYLSYVNSAIITKRSDKTGRNKKRIEYPLNHTPDSVSNSTQKRTSSNPLQLPQSLKANRVSSKPKHQVMNIKDALKELEMTKVGYFIVIDL